MKICVYTISKNEEKFVKRFYASAKDADYILIADTGSIDKTVSIARECGITVYSISVQPWRFDTARNIALGLVPADVDVCVSLDLDEILLEGWREEIERVWVVGKTNILQHLFRNSFGVSGNQVLKNSEGISGNQVLKNSEGISDKSEPYDITRIFSRFGWIWKGMCHEICYADPRMKREWVFTNKVMIEHLPDKIKSKDSYAKLIKANVDEYPTDLYARYYYAKRMYLDKRYEECIVETDKLIELCPSDISKHDPGFSRYELNYIHMLKGSCFIFLEEYIEAEKNYKIACNMDLGIRCPLITLATFYFNREKYALSYEYFMKALEIQDKLRRRDEISFWGYAPWSWAAISAAKMGWTNKAIECGVKALELNPTNENRRVLSIYKNSLGISNCVSETPSETCETQISKDIRTETRNKTKTPDNVSPNWEIYVIFHKSIYPEFYDYDPQFSSDHFNFLKTEGYVPKDDSNLLNDYRKQGFAIIEEKDFFALFLQQ